MNLNKNSFKNCMYYYFDHIIKFEDFNFDILIDDKSDELEQNLCVLSFIKR